MTTLFISQLPITEVDQRHVADFIQGWDIPLGLHPKHRNFKPAEEAPPPKITIVLQWAVEGGSLIRSWSTAIFEWPTPTLGSSALGSGWMAAASIQIPFKTGKPSGNIWAVSMVLVWTWPMDVSMQQSIRANPLEKGSTLL